MKFSITHFLNKWTFNNYWTNLNAINFFLEGGGGGRGGRGCIFTVDVTFNLEIFLDFQK